MHPITTTTMSALEATARQIKKARDRLGDEAVRGGGTIHDDARYVLLLLGIDEAARVEV